MCVETGVKKQLSKGKFWNVKSCKCKRGYVGNGITCADEKTGIHKIRIDWMKILKFDKSFIPKNIYKIHINFHLQE